MQCDSLTPFNADKTLKKNCLLYSILTCILTKHTFIAILNCYVLLLLHPKASYSSSNEHCLQTSYKVTIKAYHIIPYHHMTHRMCLRLSSLMAVGINEQLKGYLDAMLICVGIGAR